MVQIPPSRPYPSSYYNSTKKSIKIQVLNRTTDVRQDNMSKKGTKDNYIYKYEHPETPSL